MKDVNDVLISEISSCHDSNGAYNTKLFFHDELIQVSDYLILYNVV
jgi:hypothetical protein